MPQLTNCLKYAYFLRMKMHTWSGSNTYVDKNACLHLMDQITSWQHGERNTKMIVSVALQRHLKVS
jgi:hypothetical protein